jgi:hypothetical protein
LIICYIITIILKLITFFMLEIHVILIIKNYHDYYSPTLEGIYVRVLNTYNIYNSLNE